MNMTEGCISLATANNARTSFSPSPTCTTKPEHFYSASYFASALWGLSVQRCQVKKHCVKT